MVDADGLTPAGSDGLGSLLAAPGLVVLAGGPGMGRSTALRRLVADFRGPVFIGGGLATLRHLPGMALARAVRAALPERDAPLAAEAVRARVGDGLLVVDDVHHADALSLAVLPLLADVCRVLVAIRTPGGLPVETERALRAAATRWTVLPGLDQAAARALVRQVAPALDERGVDAVLARAGGNPLAVRVLAARGVSGSVTPVTAAAPGGTGTSGTGTSGTGKSGTGTSGTGASPETAAAGELDRAVAAAVADLPRPARTALAALGLLGRPAPAALLGPGVPDLLAAGWVSVADDLVAPAPRYLAEVAAAVLPWSERAGLHRRLADLLDGLESARHSAAGGDAAGAYRSALSAGRTATTIGDRAAALLLAVDAAQEAAAEPGALAGAPLAGPAGERPRPLGGLRLEAAEAALAVGDTAGCRRLLAIADFSGPGDQMRAAVLRAEALLQAGDPAEALTAAVGAFAATGPAPAVLRAEHARVVLLAALAADPPSVEARAAAIPADLAGYPAVRVALAALGARDRRDGWVNELSAAATAALADGRTVDAWWSGWLLTENLLADGRVAEAHGVAGRYRAACAGQLAYSWETRFAAAELWCGALLGADLDAVVRGAVDLLDRTLPAQARSYALAAGCLALADTGALAPARARLDRAGPAGDVVNWVDREVAWLDGQPDRVLAAAAAAGGSAAGGGSFAGGLGAVTVEWARHDTGGTSHGEPTHRLLPVRATLSAWAAVDRGVVAAPSSGRPTPSGPTTAFEAAAALWQGSVLREQIRCLLAAGLSTQDAERALPPLLAAEKYAEHAGLTVLLGRVHRALRRFSVRRASVDLSRTGTLTAREREVLTLVAAGEPTRRIAGQLGISRETVETHVRAGMRKLGARTRTEAATVVLAGAR